MAEDKGKEDKNEFSPSKMSDEDRMSRLDEWFVQAADAEKDFRTQSYEDERFYLGDQWDAKSKKALDDEGRPALTYNHVFSVVNVVNGYHRQNKRDLKVHNIKGGSQPVAEILTALLKHIKQTRNGDWEISTAHLLGLIAGKSYLMLNIDYDEDLTNGQLYLEFVPHQEILFDPFGSRYDLADRDYFFRSVWMPKPKIQRMFPKSEISSLEVQPFDRMISSSVETDNYVDAGKYQEQDDQDITRYRYRVKEAWWKEYIEKKFLISKQTGQVINTTELPKRIVDRIMAVRPEMAQVRRVYPQMHMSQYVGQTELYHSHSPMGGMMHFPIVGYFPYFIRGKCQGMITQLKDPQREHNKRMSQALHHLNSQANSGYTADADAVDDWAELEANISKAGYIKKIKKGFRFEKDKPSELSQGHIQLAGIGANAIKSISGVNSDVLGEKTSETESGVAIARRQAAGQVATAVIQDNLMLTLKILGDRMVEGIQKSGAYSKDEVMRLIVDEKDQEIEINRKQANTERVLNDLSIGSYETVVATTIQTPTARLANYAALLDAIKNGVPIPPNVLIDASDLPEKENINKTMAQQAQAKQKALQIELAEKQKDRDIELKKIDAQIQGKLLIEALKGQIAAANVKEEKKVEPKKGKK